MKKTGHLIFSAILIFLMIYLIADASNVINTTRNSLDTCLSIIIPSLFASMVISDLLISSGMAEFIVTPLYKISPWFKGDKRLFSVFVLSLLGGYPVGVVLLNNLIAYNKCYCEISKKMLAFCYCPSPAFIIGIIGLQLYGSIYVGLLIYLSNVLSCSFVCVIVNIFFIKRCNNADYKEGDEKKGACVLLTESLIKTMRSLSVICAVIITFNILLGIPRYMGINTSVYTDAFTELTNVANLQKNDYSLLPFLSALTSTGGLCIVFQAVALAKGNVSLCYFLLSRVPTATLSALICLLLTNWLDFTVAASARDEYVFSLSPVNPICSICLIIMTCFLLKFSKKITEKQ